MSVAAMKTVRAAAGLCALLAASPGCSVVAAYHLDDPREELRVVAVAPMAIHSSGNDEIDVRLAGISAIFASELVKFDRFSVIRPRKVAEVLAREGLASIETQKDAARIARLVGADAIIVGEVTDYDPYEPPRIGLKAMLVTVNENRGSGPGNVDRFDFATAGRLQTPSGAKRSLPAGWIDVEYDMRRERVGLEYKVFTLYQDTRRGLAGATFLRITDNFLCFVSNLAIRDLFRRASQADEEVGAGGELAEEDGGWLGWLISVADFLWPFNNEDEATEIGDGSVANLRRKSETGGGIS